MFYRHFLQSGVFILLHVSFTGEEFLIFKSNISGFCFGVVFCFCLVPFFHGLYFYLSEMTYLKKSKHLNLGYFLLNWQMMGLLNGGYFDLFRFLVEISGYFVH